MSGRLVAQIIVAGGSILLKAFGAAYQQAVKNAANRSAGVTANKLGDSLTRQTGITLEEARQILNVDKDTDMVETLKKYDHLFKTNDPSVGGSYYLQGKVYRAKERLELEHNKSQPATEKKEANP